MPQTYLITYSSADKKGKITKKIFLYKFNCVMSSAAVLQYLEKEGCRPANRIELEALCKEYPYVHSDFCSRSFKDLKRKSPIVVLGEDESVVFIRQKFLKLRRAKWRSNCRFAAVKK